MVDNQHCIRKQITRILLIGISHEVCVGLGVNLADVGDAVPLRTFLAGCTITISDTACPKISKKLKPQQNISDEKGPILT